MKGYAPGVEDQKISCYCGHSWGSLLRTRIRGGKEQPIARCKKCGTVQKGGLDRDQHEEFHRTGKQTSEIELDSMSESYADRNLVDIRRRVSDLQPMLAGDEMLLDFGTGMGHFLDAIDQYVDTAIGSEINRERITFVREELGFDCYDGTDMLLETFDEDSFDVVMMFHALEHLSEPLEQLQSIRRLLADDGLLVVEVPNHSDWLLRVSKAYSDFYYQDAHAYYFTSETLQHMLAQAGFAVQITGVQRYSLKNALHWLTKGEPELNSPSRYKDSWKEPIDKLYGEVIRRARRSDTLWAVGTLGQH